jgi:hypothetical protein
VEWLPLAQFSYNDKIQSSTGYSPFFLNYGHHPRKGIEPQTSVKAESADIFASRMHNLAQEAIMALARAADDMKHYYDEHCREPPDYSPGNLVYLEATNLRSDLPSKKLDDHCFGPFKVLKKVGECAYQLDLPRTWKRIHPVFHTTLLRPYKSPVSSLQQQPPLPPPMDLRGTPEYEVEEILDSHERRGKKEFLVKWRGQPQEESTVHFFIMHGLIMHHLWAGPIVGCRQCACKMHHA